MKVLQLIKTSEGATWAWRQVRELVRLGHEMHVVLPGEGLMAPRYADVGAKVHYLPCDIALVRTPLRFNRQAHGLRHLVRSIDPQIVHSHFVGTTLMMRLAMKGMKIPRLFQVPGLLHLENGLTRLVERYSSGRHDYWAASCLATRAIYEGQGIDRSRIGLAYYGSDFTRTETSTSPGTLRAELGIPDGEPIVGMVAYAYAPKRWLGYKRGIKGHEDLIDALALLRAAGTPVHGVFVGGPWVGADDYYRQIVEYGRQRLADFGHFLGTRDDVDALYPEFDVAVHPSHSENLGGAVESLAMAVPTVATNIGGFPDIVRPGETGWLAPARSPEQLAATIGEALANPQRGRIMAKAGRQLMHDMIDATRTAGQIAEVYRAILKRQPLP